MAKGPVYQRYEAFIDDINHVYDGDTITHTHFRLARVWEHAVEGEVYPDHFVKDGILWMHTSVRLAGIDCPEYHPHHRLPDGTLRDPKDVGWEHAQAVKAKQVVQDLILQNDLKFEIRNPQLGKYAERVVAEVWLRDPGTHNSINVSERLLEKNLAYRYEGGTKQIWKRPDAE